MYGWILKGLEGEFFNFNMKLLYYVHFILIVLILHACTMLGDTHIILVFI